MGLLELLNKGLEFFNLLEFCVEDHTWVPDDVKKEVKQIKLKKRETGAKKENELSNCDVRLGLEELEETQRRESRTET